MKLFIFFGLPGAGKTFSAKVAEKYFGYYLYDGDNDLTREMKYAIQKQAAISDEMRNIFFTNLIQSAYLLLKKHDKVIIHQTFIKERFRQQFLKAIPFAEFILIDADTEIREKRLRERKEFPLEEGYARKMVLLFDKPLVKHKIIKNNLEGEEAIKKQLQKILV